MPAETKPSTLQLEVASAHAPLALIAQLRNDRPRKSLPAALEYVMHNVSAHKLQAPSIYQT
eukprot:3139737-Alexandrium_andersonii.AAC.1